MTAHSARCRIAMPTKFDLAAPVKGKPKYNLFKLPRIVLESVLRRIVTEHRIAKSEA